jgi:hypothetical protein
VTLREFAAQHHVSRATVARWRQKGYVLEQHVAGLPIRVRLADERTWT